MLNKLAESIEMSFDVPTSEREMAIDASERFKAVSSALEKAMNKLDLMYDVFKRHENISTEAIVERRGVFKGRFRREVIEDYQEVLERSFKAMDKLSYFSIDSDIAELISSFEENVGEIKDFVDEFTKVLRDDYEKEDFRNQVLGKIDAIRKSTKQLDNLIYDRIIDHIDANILAKNWVDSVSDELKEDIQERVPLLVQLYEQRQKSLDGVAPDMPKVEQAMNPSDAQRAYYPDRSRTFQIGEEHGFS